jgi:hypothetical protein
MKRTNPNKAYSVRRNLLNIRKVNSPQKHKVKVGNHFASVIKGNPVIIINVDVKILKKGQLE